MNLKWLVASLLVVCAPLMGCGDSSLSGDACTVQADCAEGLTCQGKNSSPDGGVNPDHPHICEYGCATDADCAQAKSHFGDTPKCGHDPEGNNLCTLDL